ncbi:hypothetical protein BRC96_09075 [Halobacteriales archaeon QS_6_64_34]|nr:MAG: hypothetical protein BRC96_09075 [Halobacteriales archaeon QS_6_64_34]
MAEGDIRTLVVDDSEFFADMTAETLTQEHGMGAVAVYSGADAVERLTEEEFASVVSHDLRNPLNVATSALELLDAEDDDLVEKIDRSLDRMGDIIEDVLTLAREGRAVDEPEWVAIGALEDGFYVADDGTGIGLAIVAQIADAHGWGLDLADSEAGGARFELTDVATCE